MVGSDLETGAERMTWGIPELSDGIGFVVVGMGVFGFGEILRNLEQPGHPRDRAGQGDRPDADAAGPEGCGRRHRPRHRASARCSASCRAAAPSSRRSPPTRLEKRVSKNP